MRNWIAQHLRCPRREVREKPGLILSVGFDFGVRDNQTDIRPDFKTKGILNAEFL